MTEERAKLRAIFDEAALLYDAAGYLRVLNTYSGHRSLSIHARERLFHGIAELIKRLAERVNLRRVKASGIRLQQERPVA